MASVRKTAGPDQRVPMTGVPDAIASTSGSLQHPNTRQDVRVLSRWRRAGGRAHPQPSPRLGCTSTSTAPYSAGSVVRETAGTTRTAGSPPVTAPAARSAAAAAAAAAAAPAPAPAPAEVAVALRLATDASSRSIAAAPAYTSRRHGGWSSSSSQRNAALNSASAPPGGLERSSSNTSSSSPNSAKKACSKTSQPLRFSHLKTER